MAIDPRISLMGIQPQFSLFDLGATMRTGQQLQAGRLALTEEQRRLAEEDAIRAAYRQQFGGASSEGAGAPAPAGLAGLAPLSERQLGGAPSAAFPGGPAQPLPYTQGATPVDPRQAQGPGVALPTPPPGPEAMTPLGQPQGLAGQAPADRQGQNRAFVSKLYTIDPKAAMAYENHLTATTKAQSDAQEAQMKANVARVEFLGRVADGVLESGNPQQAWEVGRAMLIEQGMPPGQVPTVYDPSYVRQLSGMARDAKDKYNEGMLRLNQAKEQRERTAAGAKAPDYGLGEGMNAMVYEMFGDEIAPGQRPTASQVQQARARYLSTDPEQRLHRARARREEGEATALEGVQALEPGAPEAPQAAGAGRRAAAPLSARQHQVADEIRAEARRQDVDPELAVAVARQESDLNPAAVGDNGQSVGLFQLQPAAAREGGIDPARRTDRASNIKAGVAYLKQKLAQSGGKVDEGLSRYNRGTPTYEGRGDPNYVENVRRYLRPAGDAAPVREGGPGSRPGQALVRRLAGNGGAAPIPATAADTTPPDRSPGQAPPPAPGLPLATTRGQAQAAPVSQYGPAPVSQQGAGPAPEPAPPRLTADEQRLTGLERLRDKQEKHIERLRPLAGSEAGSKRLQQGERELSRMNSEIDTLRTRIHGPEQEGRKTAAREEAQRRQLRGQTTAETLKEHAPMLVDVQTGTPVNPATPYGEVLDQQRAGTVKQLGKRQSERLEVAREAVPVLQRMQQYVDVIYGPGGELASATRNDLQQLLAGTLPEGHMQRYFPTLVEAARYVESNASTLARGLKGEVGAMTEQDIERVMAGLPHFRSLFSLGLGVGGGYVPGRGIGPSVTVKPQLRMADTERTARNVLQDTIDTVHRTTAAILGQKDFQYEELRRAPVSQYGPAPVSQPGAGPARPAPGGAGAGW